MAGARRGGAWLGGHATGTYLTLGLQLAIAVTVFFFLGRWADEKFGSAPWGMLVGLAVGITGGFIKFFRTALTLGREADREAREGKPDAH
jgi:F0F1-type ATP synthase assembly protein I